MFEGNENIEQKESLDLQISWPSQLPPSQLPLPETRAY